MAFNEKEQEIIKYGLQNGKSRQEVEKAITNLRLGIAPIQKKIEKPSYLQRVGEDIKQSVQQAEKDISTQDNRSSLSKGISAVSNIAGAVTAPLAEAPILKQVGEVFSKGINLGGEELSKLYSPEFQASLARMSDDEFKQATQPLQDIQNLGNIANTILMARGGQGGVKTIENVGKKTLSATKNIKPVVSEIVSKVTPESSALMEQVARINPTDTIKFKKMTGGKTVGQYLTESGNFKSPVGIITNEAKKFVDTLQKKENTLSKLPGFYRDGSIADALSGLVEKARKTSGKNVKSPYLKQILDLQKKYNSTGVSMNDVNTIKKLYEKNVKLGYSKLTEGDSVIKATNIDKALNKFQDKTAQELGFTNIRDLSKQIQTSRFIVDKLGDKIVDQKRLNNVGLSDWVVLSGGNPTAIAGFLTKKFFSSKTVKAKIAEKINKEKIKPLVEPKFKETPENINRKINPQGFLALPEGKIGVPQSQNFVPILKGGEFTMEKGVPIPSKPILQLKPKIKKSSSVNTTKKTSIKSSKK